MKRKKKILTFICAFLFVCMLSVVAYASTNSFSSYHDVSTSTTLHSSTECSSLDWITSSYTWTKGGLFAKDKCAVFMQTAGISSGQTNEVTATIWNNGQVYSSDTQTSAKISIVFNVKGKLWSASSMVQTEYDASYVALGNQHWTVLGN